MAKITRVDQAVPTIKTKKKVAAYARISMESERMNHSSPHRSATTVP